MQGEAKSSLKRKTPFFVNGFLDWSDKTGHFKPLPFKSTPAHFKGSNPKVLNKKTPFIKRCFFLNGRNDRI